MTGIELMKQTNKEAFDDPLPGDLWHERFNEILRVIKVESDGSLFIWYHFDRTSQILKVTRYQFELMLTYSGSGGLSYDALRGKKLYDLTDMVKAGEYKTFEESGLRCGAIEIFKEVYVVADEKALIDLCLDIGIKKPIIDPKSDYPLLVNGGKAYSPTGILSEDYLKNIRTFFNSVCFNKLFKTVCDVTSWNITVGIGGAK